MKDIKQIAPAAWSVTVTSGANGYPANLRPAWVGFGSFEQAEEAARAIGGAVVHLRQRDGWRYFEERGRAWEAYDLQPEDVSAPADGCDFVTVEESAAYVEELRKFARENAEYYELSAEDLAEELARLDKLAEDLAGLPRDRKALIFGGEMCATYPRAAMNYARDVWRYYIGVVAE